MLILLSRAGCERCDRARELLQSKNLTYRELDVDSSSDELRKWRIYSPGYVINEDTGNFTYYTNLMFKEDF